ncbi:hypothetical protein CC80DRAFT_550408 [Byssothecium circinans]|uniref:Uncharacterized protein n=1 Tax=Byssothecium circinans TaxID=147558 RepID=A0A6A5TRU1_9PLEO|nr:hypothetical protein CC80DRAFT_550408 [Byssothecium circinans]
MPALAISNPVPTLFSNIAAISSSIPIHRRSGFFQNASPVIKIGTKEILLIVLCGVLPILILSILCTWLLCCYGRAKCFSVLSRKRPDHKSENQFLKIEEMDGRSIGSKSEDMSLKTAGTSRGSVEEQSMEEALRGFNMVETERLGRGGARIRADSTSPPVLRDNEMHPDIALPSPLQEQFSHVTPQEISSAIIHQLGANDYPLRFGSHGTGNM